jgi:pimeloyl-ACP methyl ester carboxylesterase
LTVVCLHGLGRTPSDWDGVRSGLERFGPVHAPRLPRDPAAALAVAEAAVEPGAVVVGHSMGGVSRCSWRASANRAR